MPVARLVTLILGHDDYWGPHEENTARLLEAQAYALDFAWADRTIDPDDPEVKAERARMRKRKPPPHPIVPPVARRPAKFAEQRAAEYMAEIQRYAPPAQEPVDPFDQLALWKAQRGLASK